MGSMCVFFFFSHVLTYLTFSSGPISVPLWFVRHDANYAGSWFLLGTVWVLRKHLLVKPLCTGAPTHTHTLEN